jgi:hypothetical protein
MPGEEWAALGAGPEVTERASEKWFAAEDGLRTIQALLKNWVDSKISDRDPIE